MGDGEIRTRTQAPVDRVERWRTNTRYGDIQPSTLARVLANGANGDVADLVDLIEFVIDTTPFISNLYETRMTRVMQSAFAINPNPFGDKLLAKQAADLVSGCIARIPDWHQVQRDLLHAIACGHGCGENEWCSPEEAAAENLNWVKSISFRHGHRFRYDEVWELRLHDHGMKRAIGSIYGEPLIPHKWTIHQYRVQAGYPGIGGVMRSCLWIWLFLRMTERWWLTSTERNGQPFWRGEVPKNTPESVRNDILASLEGLSADHVAVLEEDVKIIVDATASAARSHEGYFQFLGYAKEALTLAWLGMSDATTPGANGARAAVESRTDSTLDPRTIADGLNFGASLEKTLFKSLIACNAHRFSVPVDRVPIPQYRYAQLSQSDDVQSQALNGAQMDSLSLLVQSVAAGTIPRSSAIALAHMALPMATEEQLQKLVPQQGSLPAALPAQAPFQARPAGPKAPTPVAPGMSRSLQASTVPSPTQTTARPQSAFAKTVRRA